MLYVVAFERTVELRRLATAGTDEEVKKAAEGALWILEDKASAEEKTSSGDDTGAVDVRCQF